MTQARKYAFDTEFGPDGAIVRASVSRPTPEMVEVERAAAYERGKQDAIAQAERQAAAALTTLADVASATLSRLDAESRALRDDAAALAFAAARKIAGASLDAYGEARALASVETAMNMLRHQPRLLIKLPPDMIALLNPRLDALRETHAYAGALIVREDSALSAGAVTIDWTDGMVTHDPEEVARRIETIIQDTLADPAATAL